MYKSQPSYYSITLHRKFIWKEYTNLGEKESKVLFSIMVHSNNITLLLAIQETAHYIITILHAIQEN